jgi:hypothetical protein
VLPGNLSGAIFIDQAFESFARTRISRWDGLPLRDKSKVLSNEWEFGIKRTFDGFESEDSDEEERSWTVQLPPRAIDRLHALSLYETALPSPFNINSFLKLKRLVLHSYCRRIC